MANIERESKRKSIRKKALGIIFAAATATTVGQITIELATPPPPQILLYQRPNQAPDPAICNRQDASPRILHSSNEGQLEIFHQLNTTSDLIWISDATVIGVDTTGLRPTLIVEISGTSKIEPIAEQTPGSELRAAGFSTASEQNQLINGVTVEVEVTPEIVSKIGGIGGKLKLAQINLSDGKEASSNRMALQHLGDNLTFSCHETVIFDPHLVANDNFVDFIGY